MKHTAAEWLVIADALETGILHAGAVHREPGVAQRLREQVARALEEWHGGDTSDLENADIWLSPNRPDAWWVAEAGG